MQRAVHLSIALAALITLIVGGRLLLEHAGRIESLTAAPSHQSARPARRQLKARVGAAHPRSARQRPGARAPLHGSTADSFMRSAPAYLGLAAWIGLLTLGIASATTVDRRLRNRLSRRYGRYEIKLSMHDDAKPGDLEDMVEAIGAAVRKRYSDRVSDGQPFVALELWHRPSDAGLQWTLCLVCEAQMTRTLEAIIAGAYPDVRVGREFDEERDRSPTRSASRAT